MTPGIAVNSSFLQQVLLAIVVIVVVVVVIAAYVTRLVRETLSSNHNTCYFSRGRRDTGQIRGRLGAMSAGVPPSCVGITASAAAATTTALATATLSFDSLLLPNDNAT